MSNVFGTELRKEREKQGLTAEMVAEVCGVSRSYITLIENGKRLPGKKVLPKFALALQIKIATVLNWYLMDISQRIQANIESV